MTRRLAGALVHCFLKILVAILLILPGKSLRLTAFGRVLQNRGRLKKPREGIYWFTCWKEGATPRSRCNAFNVGLRRG